MTETPQVRRLMDMRNCNITSINDVVRTIQQFLTDTPEWDGIILAPTQAELILEKLPRLPGTRPTDIEHINNYPIEIE
jgi:hypothetical protein